MERGFLQGTLAAARRVGVHRRVECQGREVCLVVVRGAALRGFQRIQAEPLPYVATVGRKFLVRLAEFRYVGRHGLDGYRERLLRTRGIPVLGIRRRTDFLALHRHLHLAFLVTCLQCLVVERGTRPPVIGQSEFKARVSGIAAHEGGQVEPLTRLRLGVGLFYGYELLLGSCLWPYLYCILKDTEIPNLSVRPI